MNNSENWIVGSALLGLSLVLGAAAAAMEPDKNTAFAQSSPSPTLPAFLDGARLPNLQDTWKRGEGEPAAVPQPGSNTALSQDRLINQPEAPSAASATRQPAEHVARPVATVRQRAEELSRRFSGGVQASTPQQGGASKITTGALPDDTASEPRPAQGEQAETVAQEPANESKRAAGLDVRTAPPLPRVKRAAIPPLPLRAPRTAQLRKPLLPPKSRVGAVPRSTSPAPSAAKRAKPPVMIPDEFQSLGWNAEVHSR